MTKSNVITLRNEFEGRRDAFVEDYEWTEQREVLEAVKSAGELVCHIFGDVAASRTMAACRAAIGKPVGGDWSWSAVEGFNLDADWRDEWDAIDAFEDTSFPRLMEDLHDLRGLAYFGILPSWHLIPSEANREDERWVRLRTFIQRSSDIPTWVKGVVQDVEALAKLAPLADLASSLEVCLAAQARLKFEDDQALSREELAALSRTSLKRVQNAIYGKSEGAPMLDKQGLIPASNAHQWLSDRGFTPSIWREVLALAPLSENWGEDVVFETVEEDEIIDDYIFVPVAKDGSIFAPSLARGRDRQVYTIGAKGSEQTFESFEEALGVLCTMTKAYWRRPNDNGNWGIVGAESWRRVRRSQLGG